MSAIDKLGAVDFTFQEEGMGTLIDMICEWFSISIGVEADKRRLEKHKDDISEELAQELKEKLDKDIKFWEEYQQKVLDAAAEEMGISREELDEVCKQWKESKRKDH